MLRDDAPVADDLSGRALLRANEANSGAFVGALRRAPGVEVDDRPGRLRVATGIGHSIFNGVYATHLPAAEADAYVDESRAYFAAKQLPWMWWVWPDAEPADLGDRLAARGFALRNTVPAMSVDLRTLREGRGKPEGLTIERVTDASGLAVAADLAGATFGLAPEKRPRYLEVVSAFGFAGDAPFQSYVGSVDGTPVAVSQGFLGAGVVGVYTVATLKEHRGRGYGGALTLAPLGDARGKGYRYGILQSTAMGRPVYERLGFRADGDVRLYGPPPATPS